MRVSAIFALAFRSAKPPAFRNSVDYLVLIGIGPDKRCRTRVVRQVELHVSLRPSSTHCRPTDIWKADAQRRG